METRAIETTIQSSGNRVSGYAAVYNRTAIVLDKVTGRKFREVILPGAFRAAPTQDVRLLNAHQPSPVYARTRSGTLRLSDDDIGLAFDAELPDTESGRERKSEIGRRDISGMSFGWQPGKIKDRWSMKDGMPTREIIEVEIHEISFTGFPAYVETSVDLRSVSFEEPNGIELLELKQKIIETFWR